MIYPNITLEVENDCLRARLKADKEVAQSVMALLDLPDTDMEEVFKLLKQIKGLRVCWQSSSLSRCSSWR